MNTNSKAVNWKKWIIPGAAVIIAIVALIFYMTGQQLLRETYKQSHITLVKPYAEEFDQDEYLVASIAFVESHYDVDAVSNKGARGMMQIMPDTGEWLAGKLKLADYSADMLDDPKVSLRMACWYLEFLQKRYDGDRTLMLCAYNAGQTNVDKWLKDERYSRDGKTLSVIPFDQTENYVNKVNDAYAKYTELYAANKADDKQD